MLNVEPLAPGRQGRQLPAEITLASWALLLAAFSPKQEVFSKLVIPSLAFPPEPAGPFRCLLVERGESRAGGAGQGLRAREQQREPHLGSCRQRCWPSSSCGFRRGPSLSRRHRTALGTRPVSFVFKAPAQTARENRIWSRNCVKTLPGSAQTAGIRSDSPFPKPTFTGF